MRKSLLMTSALGLIIPTLAMAGAAAVGSSGVACHSGFFAQLDAKIMNAKLTIKNEKKKTPENSEKEADVEANLIAAQEAALAKMDILFEGLPAAQITKLRADIANGGLNITALLNANDEIAFQKVLLKALVINAGLGAAVAAGVAAGTAADNNAIDTAADLPALERLATTAAGGAGGAALVANPGAAGLALDVWKKVVTDAKRLVKAIEADAAELQRIKGLGAAPAHLNTITIAGANNFAFKTLISTHTATGGAITFNNRNYNVADFDNIFVIASTQIGSAGAATFAAAKEIFLNGAAGAADPKIARATELKGVGWFADSVKKRKELIADKNAAIAKDNVNFDRRVHHHALAGGVGGTVGWWQNLGGFALSISGGADYLWGTFRTVDDASGSTVKAEDKKKLGFGLQGDVGVHYVVSPSTTLGVLIGLRGQQLNFGRKDKGTATTTTSSKDSKGDYASKWMINPVVSLQARTFFTDAVYGALTVGYVIPLSDKDFKLDNTKIDKDAKINFQGLTGAFSVGMMF